MDYKIIGQTVPVVEMTLNAVDLDLSDDELIKMEEEIKSILPNSSTLFFDKKTVFKVKKK